MRYLLHLAYSGEHFHGWQSQKNDPATIQFAIENALFTIGRKNIRIVGCGRTDAGVHATDYVAHFDSDQGWEGKEYQLNGVLDKSIVIYKIALVPEDFHARFDAISRSYEYRLHTRRDPFTSRQSYLYYTGIRSIDKMNQVGELLTQYNAFFPFCKSNSGVDHYRCTLHQAEWVQLDDHHYQFNIQANRFLRGMVRLIVGASLLVDAGKMSLNDIKVAMDQQERLPRDLSVPAQGLFLSRVEYGAEVEEILR